MKKGRPLYSQCPVCDRKYWSLRKICIDCSNPTIEKTKTAIERTTSDRHPEKFCVVYRKGNAERFLWRMTKPLPIKTAMTMQETLTARGLRAMVGVFAKYKNNGLPESYD